MRTERHWRPYPVDKDTCGLYLPAYKYGGEIGATMLDISGNNHHGVITGAVPWNGGFTVAQSATKISGVDETAFIDIGFNPGWYPGRRVLIRSNTNGTFITGYVGALGTGETLDSEILQNGTFPSDLADWDLTVGAGGGTITWDAGTMKFTQGAVSELIWASQDQTVAIGALIKFVAANITNYTTDYLRMRIGSTKNGGQSADSGYFGAASKSLYGTMTTTTGWFSVGDGQGDTKVSNWDNLSAKKVLTPSATGCTIVSTRGGSTQNWKSKDASFNYNDSAGYTIYLEGEGLQGRYLDGVDDVITVPDFVETGNSAKELTVLVWQRYLDTAATKYFIGHWNDATPNQRAWTMRYAASNKVSCLITDDGIGGAGHLKNYTTSIVGWSNTSWILIGFTFNNGTLTLYANGVADTNPTKTTDNAITTIHNSTSAITIGCVLASGLWSAGAQCVIEEVSIFNDVKSALWIRNYFELTRSRYGV